MEDKYNEEFEKKSKGIDAFVTALISLITFMFWYLCLPLSIYGLVKGIIALNESGSKLAKTAIILSIIAMTLCVVVYTQRVLYIYSQQ